MLTPVDADMTVPEVEVLRALADPLRLRIVTLLAHETLCTTHLVEETGARQTNLSNHLKVLRDAGIVDTEPCGRFTYYKLRPEALAGLGDSLGELARTAHTTLESNRKRSCP